MPEMQSNAKLAMRPEALARHSGQPQSLLAGLSPLAGRGSLKGLLRSYTQRWQSGEISNFEYLMWLNTSAHRSFADLTQCVDCRRFSYQDCHMLS